MSCQTRTCASQSGPAPMPTVGMSSSAVTLSRQITRNHLQHHAEGSGVFDGVCIVQQPLRVIAATLHSVAAELVLALRGEADMAHDGDAGVSDLADLCSLRAPHPRTSLRGSRLPS